MKGIIMTKHSKKFKEEALKLFDEIGSQRDNPSLYSACILLCLNGRIDFRSNFELLKHAVWGIFLKPLKLLFKKRDKFSTDSSVNLSL